MFRCVWKGNRLPFSSIFQHKKAKLNYSVTRTRIYSKNDNLIMKKFHNVEEFLCRHSDPSQINWSEIEHVVTLDDQDRSSVNSVVFNSCINVMSVKHCISFYDYLKLKNVKLKINEYYLILILLSKLQSLNDANDEFLSDIFNSVKPFLPIHDILFESAALACGRDKRLWQEMLKIYELSEKKKDSPVPFILSCSAFEHGLGDIGWKLLKQNPKFLKKRFISSYIKYCLLMAKENKFTPALITDLVEHCNKHSLLIPLPEFVDEIKGLVDLLNTDGKSNFVWNISSAKIAHNGQCSCCNVNLPKGTLSEKDFKILEEHVLNDVIINVNIYLTTTEKELNRFREFLKGAYPYDVVVDMLNLQGATTNIYKVLNILYFFAKKKKKKLLIIARQHFKKTQTYDTIRNLAPIFFTQNMTNDDVYFIYAALFGGPNTYLISRDYLRGYANHFKNQELKDLFIKWQMNYQYSISEYGYLVSPKNYEILPQTRILNNGQHIYWHLPLSFSETSRILISETVDWACLTARAINVKKENT